jgi:beta-lactamase regulating signal transducer with metallopeptidase domain
VGTIDARLLTFLLNALWQVPALAAGAACGARLLRRAPARHRFTVWLAALLLCALLPTWSLLPARRRAEALPSVSLAQPQDAAAGAAWEGWLPAEGRRPSLPAPLAAVLVFAYGGMVLVQTVRLARACRRTVLIARGARPLELSPKASLIAERCRAAFGLPAVPLLASEDVTGPVTLGTRRPRILLPPSFVADASEAQLTAALGHELAHIRRRDYAVHLLCEALFVPVAFHPAARWVRRRLAEAREIACDEAAVERLLSARIYARSLLSMAAAFAGLSLPAPNLGVHLSDADNLEVRMKSLTDSSSRLGARRARASLAAALLLLAGLGVTAAAFAPNAAIAAAPGDLKPFLGLWQGSFANKDGSGGDLPGVDLEVRTTAGRPEGILTVCRHVKQPDGSVKAEPHDVPVYDIKADGHTLSFRQRYVLQLPPNGEKTGQKKILDTAARLDLTGGGEAVLSFVEAAAPAGKNLPPPPPPISMKRR